VDGWLVCFRSPVCRYGMLACSLKVGF
jgi:hypothetical protein